MLSELGGVERGGVEHILDDVEDVELDARGHVAAVHLKDRGGHHPVEFVVDCTGFKGGLIINKALKEPFIDYSKYLGNDRAMALQIPHPNPNVIASCTSSTALGAGWSWRVPPLFHRIGTGYVYSNAHRTDDEARDEFMAHLGTDAPPKGGAEPRVIPMRVGRTRNAWVKNCIAIGLSSGFIEPLESTAIHMIDLGIQRLIAYFPDSDFSDAHRNRYNKTMDGLYNEVLDFICLHYALGNRTDSQYWIDARTELQVPDRLAENLELWKHQPPAALDLETGHLFNHPTYQAVLMGKRVYETGYGSGRFTRRYVLRREAWAKHLMEFSREIQRVTKACSDHHLGGLLAIRGGELTRGMLKAHRSGGGWARGMKRQAVVSGDSPGLF